MIIYRITNNITGMVYIGQTKRTFAERIKEHIANQSRIGRAITKLGKENFSFDVIDRANTAEELDELERFWIEFYSFNSYNVLSGGKATKDELNMISKFNTGKHKKHKRRRAKPTTPITRIKRAPIYESKGKPTEKPTLVELRKTERKRNLLEQEWAANTRFMKITV